MVRRAQFHFREMEKATLLKALGECRRACNQASTETLFDDKPVCKQLHVLTGAIDDVVVLLTGNREHFWARDSHPRASTDGPPKES